MNFAKFLRITSYRTPPVATSLRIMFEMRSLYPKSEKEMEKRVRGKNRLLMLAMSSTKSCL